MPRGRGLLAWGGAAGGPQCYMGSRPPRPAPEGPHPRLQSGAGQRGRLGAGWGADLQTHHRGIPGEDPQGACVTLLTQPHPQRRPRLPGGAGQVPARPTSATEGRRGGGWVPGPPGTRLLGAGMGGPRERRFCGVLRTVGPGAPHSAWAGPPRAKNGTLFPVEAGRPACPHPASGAPSHPPGRQAWGEQPRRLPLLPLRGLRQGRRDPAHPALAPQPTNTGFRGVRWENGPEGACDPAKSP